MLTFHDGNIYECYNAGALTKRSTRTLVTKCLTPDPVVSAILSPHVIYSLLLTDVKCLRIAS